MKLSPGIPQGFDSGPVLFFIHTNTLFKILGFRGVDKMVCNLTFNFQIDPLTIREDST